MIPDVDTTCRKVITLEEIVCPTCAEGLSDFHGSFYCVPCGHEWDEDGTNGRTMDDEDDEYADALFALSMREDPDYSWRNIGVWRSIEAAKSAAEDKRTGHRRADFRIQAFDGGNPLSVWNEHPDSKWIEYKIGEAG